MGDSAAGIPDALLVRVATAPAGWPDRLPPVPPGEQPVTVTVGDAAVLTSSGPALASGGYRSAGVHPAARLADGDPAADLLVPHALRRSHPGWWTRLRACAVRVFDPRYGPVLELLGGEIGQHVQARERTGTHPASRT